MTQFDSKTTPAVQLAPVMIGDGHRSRFHDDPTPRPRALDAQEVIALYSSDPMLSSINFDEQKRLCQGSQEVLIISYFAESFHKT